MICDRCSAEIERGVTLPEWARGRIWTVNGEERYVRPMLRRIFKILWSRRDRAVSRDSFMTLLYGHLLDPPGDGTVKVYVSDLRRKLAGSEWGIKPIPGEGWQLVPADVAARSPYLQACALRPVRRHRARSNQRGAS